MTLRNYKNDAPPITLTVAATIGATTLTVASTAGYPAAPFILGLERGTVNEEVVLCTGITGTTFTVVRGYDGTTAKAHSIGASVEHSAVAMEYREANAHVNDVSGEFHFAPAMILMTGAAAAPTGWFLCDGAAKSRATYAALFAAIGVAFGSGDGTTTFNVPDLRDRVPIGANTIARGAAGAIGSHTHAHSLSVVANNFNTSGHSVDHGHGFSTGGVSASHTHSFAGGISTFGTSANHIHGGITAGAQWSAGQDVDHVHALDGITTGTQSADHSHSGSTAGVTTDHSHNANHGHTLSGAITAGTTHTAVGVNFIIKT